MIALGAILAGGKASRMAGANKSLLMIDGATILQRQRVVLGELCTRLVVCGGHAADEHDANMSTLRDDFPDAGPLGGIHAALACTDSWALVVAGDMPFLQRDVLALLVAQASQASPSQHAVAFMLNGRPQPLCAIYHRKLRDVIATRLVAGQRKVADVLTDPTTATRFIDEASVRRLDPDLRTFQNINTVADLQALRPSGA